MNPKTDEQYHGYRKKSCAHVPGEKTPIVADADNREKEKAHIKKFGLILDVLDAS